MAYGDGTLNLSGNLNVAIGKPLDARYIVENEADLTLSATWTVSGANYAYEGIMVYCRDTQKTMQLQGSNDYSVAANWVEVGASSGASNPVGTLIWFAGASAPAGYLLCDGSAVSRTTYSALFTVIGTIYGAGDESTTFNLPNYIDKFVEGSATAGTKLAAGLPNIEGSLHGYRIGDNAEGSKTADVWNSGLASGALKGHMRSDIVNLNLSTMSKTGGQLIDKIEFDASKSSSVYGNSLTVQPPALTALPCIKY